MTDQAPSKVFTWNNPASMTLRPCDIAEIGQLLAEGQKPTEVAVTLRRRSRKYRQVTRVGSGPIPVENYTIELLDEPTTDQAATGGPPPGLSPIAVADIRRLYALGVHRNRLAEYYNIEPAELDAILPGGIPTCSPPSQAKNPPHLSRSMFCLDRALSQRLKVVREWTPPAGVKRDVLLSFDHGRLSVELKHKGFSTRVVVLRNDPLEALEPRLDAAAASNQPLATPLHPGPPVPPHHVHSMPHYQTAVIPLATKNDEKFHWEDFQR